MSRQEMGNEVETGAGGSEAGRTASAGGYSLLELLVAMALAATALAVIGMLISGLRAALMTSGDRVDLQQRGRVVIEAVGSALQRAGAGADARGPAGPLARFMPAIVPRGRSGVLVLASSAAAPPARLAADMPAGSGAVTLEYVPGCTDPCGFSDGSAILVFDTHGDFDVFTILDVTGTVATVQRHPAGTGGSYPRGAPVLLATSQFYFRDGVASELRRSDGLGPSFAVASGVIDLAFEYFGEAQPPSMPVAAAGVGNCLYDAAGAPLSAMPVLPGAVGSLVSLDLSMFADGPWCGTGPTPFDADLLRVRAVRMTARLHTLNAALRGAGAWFGVPGSARESALLVPDVMLRADVTPPNLVRAARP